MTIGGSIGLIVLGAILAFAVRIDLAGLDIQVVGFIMMVGGVVGLIVGLSLRQRNVRTRRLVAQDPDTF
ncbi:MAG: hypothetical protein JJT89_03115 [Nitriliruptoraceae bacterium]|nr:hypothetical protein [Nitriliruptoraceae bacterium]